jgi:DNA-binding XRE family transcriptional regulator
MDFRIKLKEAREMRLLKQVDFAKSLGITPKHLNLIENCNAFPSWPLFFEMCHKLGLEFRINEDKNNHQGRQA